MTPAPPGGGTPAPAPSAASTAAAPVEPAATGSEAVPAPAVPAMPSVRLEHARALFAQGPAALAGNLIGFVLVSAMFIGLADTWRLLAWGGAMTALLLVRSLQYLRYRRRRDAEAATLLRWRDAWRTVTLLQGAAWGAAVWMFWGFGTAFHLVALILIVASYCLGSVQMLATQPPLFLGFISLAFVPTIVRIASDDSQPYHWELAGIVTLLFGITVLMGRTYRTALAQAVELKVRTDRLAAQLRAETAAAEAARRSAEAANRAKTQFFAAASHDLRQPLHAMGLFAEALRQRSHDPEVSSLVNSINESVDALEGLFGELLDITRIDTGGVDVNPAPVRLRDVFARLRLHFEPIAFEKGLALDFRGERHIAHADPVLLERILRNLVSNAIRYTEDGGVLVSCRPRGGRLLLQVWDTGIGIAEATLPRIFDEFYQVHTNRPLEPHHRKGLGLGLAIVKRLAALIEAPLAVRSRLHHGTVFSVEVPLGKEPRPLEPGVAQPRQPLGLSLSDRTFVVVEDEPAVREGLVVLLQAWGARVLSFDTVEAVQAWAHGEAAEPPDVLLVDYRLPAGRTGLEALAVIRERWASRRLPAIVITGSSLSGHEDEAETHDFHVLIKPVLPNKLRAMIAFKLNVRSG